VHLVFRGTHLNSLPPNGPALSCAAQRLRLSPRH
jgi:hypothetical protein